VLVLPAAGLLLPADWTLDVARAATSTVNIRDNFYQQPSITVNVGDTVTWENDGFGFHTTTSDTALWDSGTLFPNSTFSFTFTSTGTYAYHCNIHLFMTGTVTVVDNGPATPTFTPTLVPTATPTPPNVRVSVSKVAANRLRVTIAARDGQTLSQLAWTLPANAAAQTVDGAPLPTGLTLPAGSTSATFDLRRLSGQSVTLPIVVTGSFGTWRTFAGGGPNAW
jgi:plastocyanin